MVGLLPGTCIETGVLPMVLAAIKDLYGRRLRKQQLTRPILLYHVAK